MGRLPIGGKKDDPGAKPSSPPGAGKPGGTPQEKSGGGIMGRLPVIGGKKDDPGAKPSSAPGAGKPGGTPQEKSGGGIMSRLPFGGKKDNAAGKPGAPVSAVGGSASPLGGMKTGSAPSIPGGGAKPAQKSAGGGKSPLEGIRNSIKNFSLFGGAAAKKAAKPAPKMKGGKPVEVKPMSLSLDKRLEILGIAMVISAIVIILSSLSPTKGALTEGINRFLAQTFGWGAIGVPLAMLPLGIWLIMLRAGEDTPVVDTTRVIGVVLLYLCLLTLFQFIHAADYEVGAGQDYLTVVREVFLPISADLGRGGGRVGGLIYYQLISNLTEIGGFLVLLMTMLVSIMLATSLSLSQIGLILIGMWRGFDDARRRWAVRRAAKQTELAEKRRQALAAKQPPEVTAPAAPAPLPAPTVKIPIQSSLPLPPTVSASAPGLSPAVPAPEAERSIAITTGGRRVTASLLTGTVNEAEDIRLSEEDESPVSAPAAALTPPTLTPASPPVPAASAQPEKSEKEEKKPGLFGGMVGALPIGRGAKPDEPPAAKVEAKPEEKGRGLGGLRLPFGKEKPDAPKPAAEKPTPETSAPTPAAATPGYVSPFRASGAPGTSGSPGMPLTPAASAPQTPPAGGVETPKPAVTEPAAQVAPAPFKADEKPIEPVSASAASAPQLNSNPPESRSTPASPAASVPLRPAPFQRTPLGAPKPDSSTPPAANGLNTPLNGAASVSDDEPDETKTNELPKAAVSKPAAAPPPAVTPPKRTLLLGEDDDDEAFEDEDELDLMDLRPAQPKGIGALPRESQPPARVMPYRAPNGEPVKASELPKPAAQTDSKPDEKLAPLAGGIAAVGAAVAKPLFPDVGKPTAKSTEEVAEKPAEPAVGAVKPAAVPPARRVPPWEDEPKDAPKPAPAAEAPPAVKSDLKPELKTESPIPVPAAVPPARQTPLAASTPESPAAPPARQTPPAASAPASPTPMPTPAPAPVPAASAPKPSAPVSAPPARTSPPVPAPVVSTTSTPTPSPEPRSAPPPERQSTRQRKEYRVPDFVSLLQSGTDNELNHEKLIERAKVIEDTLSSFGAPGRVVEVRTGPVITQFGVEPDYLVARGGKKNRVKVSAIAALDKDLQLALGAKSIRIEAPVPGKGYVGIEVPNEAPTVVRLRDVLESPEYTRIKSPLAIALGQSVDGTPVAAALDSMPHLLIAGTTGSGKSVCVNAIIGSLLLRNSPDRLKFIMVDPKRVELTGYNGIPHLIAPVVVEHERAVGVLKWLTREMDDRYRRFANAGARNLDDYNRHVPAGEEPLPYIVVIVDELADLMMLSPDETERAITRIAALARATGIHLVIATQRPSVDVVTGLIKANFPARIAFAVASGTDSRVILDQPGADRLLGRGDMLYMSADSPAPVRLQGVYVSDQEIGNITRYWRSQVDDLDLASRQTISTFALDESVGKSEGRKTKSSAAPIIAPWQRDQVKRRSDDDDDDLDGDFDGDGDVDADDDELYEQAVEMVRRLNKASVSLLQRRLRIGYTRAARLIDVMEERGVVGPPVEGSKPRDVLPPKP
jgi:S-DNA-T family DNA segregation ATPase FtsK/SpoIIIE